MIAQCDHRLHHPIIGSSIGASIPPPFNRGSDAAMIQPMIKSSIIDDQI